MLKRLFLWTATNVAVIAVISVILAITGLDKALGGSSGYIPLLIMCSLFGFGGSFISLLMAKGSVKRGMNVHIIETPQTDFERWYVGVVESQAQRLGLKRPEIGIFPSPDPNAFATGASKDAALVAISSGLMERMSRDEIESVVGHEMAHVANGDMVTMMLLQGVVNTFVMFLSRIIASAIAGNRDGEESNAGIFFLCVMVLQVLFGFLAQLITSAFSRHREFRADAGGADLTSNEQMAKALEALRRGDSSNKDLPGEMAAFGISGSISSLFSTHPPLEKRIEALRHRS